MSQVRFTVGGGWRTSSHQGYIAQAAFVSFALKKPQIATVSCRGQILLKTRFEKRYPPFPKCPDPPFIHVKPRDLMAGGGKSGGCHHAQVSQSNDRDLQ